MLGPKAEEFEVWTLLSALAERTDDVDLGPLVGSITYRNPALLAKMATTVDILSEGRLRLGLGAGWHEEEHQAYGFDFPDVGTRIEMLEEGIRVVKAMFTEEDPTFAGDHYTIDGALNEPKPVSQPHPPIVVGGAGRRCSGSPPGTPTSGTSRSAVGRGAARSSSRPGSSTSTWRTRGEIRTR
nr:LLM class flavin-dependent oxidoreductase [Halomicroarcula sp. GDY20]